MRHHSHKQMLFIELKRVYFDYIDKRVVLRVLKDEEVYPANDFNLLNSSCRYLGKIDGCKQKYLLCIMRKIKNNNSAQETENIESYRERTGFPPPIEFDTLEFTVIQGDHKSNLIVDLA